MAKSTPRAVANAGRRLGTKVAPCSFMSKLWPLFVVIAACGGQSSPSLPWLRGLTPTATTDGEVPAVTDRITELTGEPDEGGYGGLEVSGNGLDVLASFHQGVVVVDGSGHVVGRAPAFASEGTADDLVSLAIGDGQLDKPVIALAVTRGGHRESTTWLVLYRVGGSGRLDRLFEQPIEEHDGDDAFVGSVTLIPQGLIYQKPHGGLERWQLDAARGRYVAPRSAAQSK